MTQNSLVAAKPTGLQRLPLRLPAAAAAALALNLIVFGLGSLAGASWGVNPPQQIGVVMILAATLTPFAIAGLGVWALSLRWPDVRRWASWAGLGFGILTAPVSVISATDVTTGVALASMHVITAVAWLLAVKPSATRS